MIDQVTREAWIEASADEVWPVVTGDGWLAESVTLDLRPGGEAAFDERSGWIEEVRVPRRDGDQPTRGRLVYWWAVDGEPASRVTIDLDERDGRTRVRVCEARPLELLDLVGLPLRGAGGQSSFGPALVAA